jgi:hypothetical protein
MKTFSDDKYPRGKHYKGTKESLHEAGRLLQKLADSDFRSMPNIVDVQLGVIEALLENVSYDEFFQLENISLKRKAND